LILPPDIPTCHKVIVDLHKVIEDLTARVVDLEDKVNKNSRNSNKPPSSDGLKKPKVSPGIPKKKGKKSGGQPGHQGKTLEISEQVDHVENHQPPDDCQTCNESLDKTKITLLEIRQVLDLPKPKLEVTEHRQFGCTCGGCGTVNKGEFPSEVTARVQYGSGVRALAVLLNIGFKLPLKKIQTLFADLFGYAVNQSTIVSAVQKCYEGLESSEEVIKNRLLQSLVAHFDETGLRVKGKLHWLHTCCNQLFTYLFIHANRGKKALLDSASLIGQFANWAIHDCWVSYFNFEQCAHGICGAHILRELTALEEKNTQWATWYKRYLLTIYYMSDEGKNQLNPQQQQKALALYNKIWTYADQAEPPPQKSKTGRGRPKATKGRNLLIRLKKHQAAVLAFAFHKEVPFTNNQAERDLRPAKIKQKVAGSFRTFEGAQRYARIQGFLSTTRKHQFSVFNELKAALSGDTFLTRDTPPK